MEQSQASNELASATDTTTSQTQVQSLEQNQEHSSCRILPAIASRNRVESMRTSTAVSNAGSDRGTATPSPSRFKVTDASLDSERYSEVSPATAIPLRLGPSLTKRHIARQSTRGDMHQSMLRREASQILHITEGVRRRMSSVLKYAGIDIDTETDKLKELWRTFDSDGDGTIDYQEFCKYTCDLLEVQNKDNGEAGTLTMIEMRLIQLVTLESKRCASLDKAVEKIFRKLDQNRSGQLSLMEFMEGIRELGLLTYNFEVHGRKRRFANNSLFLLDTKNRLRYYLVWIVEWKWFDRFILLCIVMNSCILAFRDYEDPGSIPDANGAYNMNMRNLVVEQSEKVFSWIFFAECVMKIMAMGFALGRGAYLRSYWNQLDFFVVVIGFIGDLPGVPKVSALRTARVLRPLRTLSNLRGMRILIYALFSAIPALFNVMVIIGFVFTVFGILGVLFWNGTLHYRCRETPEPVNGTWPLAGEGRLCGGEYSCIQGEYCGSVYNLPPNTTVDLDLLPSTEFWSYKFSGFDNIGFALLTLFQCITLEGWTVVMYNFQDAHNWTFASIYFVIFTIVGAFFLLQFVFAVIWERFTAVNDGTAENWDLILEERKSSTQIQVAAKQENGAQENHLQAGFSSSFQNGISTTILIVKKKDPAQRLRQVCRNIVKDDYFTYLIVLCILLNTVCLAMDEYPVDTQRTLVTENLNIALTIIFSVEMTLKVVGLGPKEYCADNYNLFDGVIVLISLVELMLNIINPDSKNNTGLSALRSFRFFRIMKLARSWDSLRKILVTIGNSILDVANFGLLLLLLMYVFALIGMQFFATKYRFDDNGDPVEWQPHVYSYTDPPHAPWTPERPYTISRSNFDDTLSAFTTVFQCLTEESWNFVMYDGVRSVGWGALLYFMAVMVIGNIIILNLFLAILLGNFSLDDQQTEVEMALLKGHQKIFEAIVKSPPVRRLSQVMPFATISNGLPKSDSRASIPQSTDAPPPLIHQDTPTRSASRIRRCPSQRSMNSSRRSMDDLGDAEEEASPLRPQNPQKQIENQENGQLLQQSSLRSRSPKAKLQEFNDPASSDENLSPASRQNNRRYSSHATLPEIKDQDNGEESTSSSRHSIHRLPSSVTIPEAKDQSSNEEKGSPGRHPTLQIVTSKNKLQKMDDHDSSEKNVNQARHPSLQAISPKAKLSHQKSRDSTKVEFPGMSPAHTSASPAAKATRFKSVDVVELDPMEKSAPKTEVIVYESDRSLFLFKRSGFVRRFCHEISRNPYFEHLILVIIFVGSILLAVDNPLNDPSSSQSIILGIMDNVFTVIFGIEMMLKVTDLGFVVNGPQSYLRDPWNVLDLAILLFSGATLFSSSKTLRSLRSFRTLRALRPLRFISRVPGMKRVVNAMLSSIPKIMNVFLVCSLIFLIFGIIGVNLFKGRLYYCDMSSFSDEKMQRLETTYGFSKLSFKKLFSKANCLEEGGMWLLRNRNYNNVLKSAMTLFELGTTEGWVDIMYEGVDATEIDYHPVQNYNRSYVVFFIAFIIIGSFFTLNLFVGAVIDNFNRMREELDPSAAENETQREWTQIQGMVQRTKLKFTVIEPRHPLRRLCFHIQQHPTFEGVVIFCVLGNTVMLAVTHFQESNTVATVLSTGNLLFCVVFLLEAIVKLMSMGKKYFYDRWNIFDFLVVGGSTASTVLPFFTKGTISPVANTVRALRMGLAVRLMKRAKSMQDIVSTILENMPALINVSTLMCLVMFVYAVIGVQIYAGVRLGANLDEHANFKDIATAMLTLFRFTTGEAWNDVMYDLMVQPIKGSAPYPYGDSCVEDYSYEMLVAARAYVGDDRLTIGCGPGVQVTYIYFLSYMLITTYVLLNLFVAVILEGFEEATERHSSTIVKEDLTQVALLWQGFDLSATGYISDHAFLRFLRCVAPPIGLPKNAHRKEIERWAMSLDLYVENGKINFHAFLIAAAQSVMTRVSEERGEPIQPARGITGLFARSQKAMWRMHNNRVRRLSLANTPSLMAIISVKRIQAIARKGLARQHFLELKRRADERVGRDMPPIDATTTGAVADLATRILHSMKVAPAPDQGPPLAELLWSDETTASEEHAEDEESNSTDDIPE